MSPIEIAAQTFPWEACATLVTGFLAVGGAVWVGKKQTHISMQQTEILKRQADVQHVAVQQALFDRRFAVHEATLALVEEAIRKRNFPDETDREFLTQREVARFLFTPKVVEKLDEIRNELIELEFQKNTAEDPKLRQQALAEVTRIVKGLRVKTPDQIAQIFLDETSITSKAP